METSIHIRPDAGDLLTPQEVARLLDACSLRAPTGIRNRALIVLLYRGGLRLKEALELEIADVDTEGQLVQVRRSGCERDVGIDAVAFRIVEHWASRRRQLGLAGPGRFLCTLRGDPLLPSYVRSLLSRLARAAGVHKRVSAEILRRTLATELVREGLPVEAIQRHLGHSSPAVTSRYLSRHDATVREVVETMKRRSSWLA